MEQEILNKIHNFQLDMISEISKICDKNNIKYIVICGTLLGAIRHKGFIPWDDDMDIGLLRDDYEKLIKLLKTNPIENCFLQDYSTDKHYYQPYAKLVRKDTIYIENYRKKCKAKNGVFIDIFPLDYIKKPGQKIIKIKRILSKLITLSIWNKEKCYFKRTGLKRLVNIIAWPISLLPKKVLISAQNKMIRCNNQKFEFVASLYSSNYETDKLYFKIADFEETIDIPFENILVKSIRNYEDLLVRLYKNYKELPPIDRRNSGHDVFKISLKNATKE